MENNSKVEQLMKETGCSQDMAERWLKLMSHDYNRAKLQISLFQSKKNEAQKSLSVGIGELQNIIHKLNALNIKTDATEILHVFNDCNKNINDTIIWFVKRSLNEPNESLNEDEDDSLSKVAYAFDKIKNNLGISANNKCDDGDRNVDIEDSTKDDVEKLTKVNKDFEKTRLLMKMIQQPEFEDYISTLTNANSAEERKKITNNFMEVMSKKHINEITEEKEQFKTTTVQVYSNNYEDYRFVIPYTAKNFPTSNVVIGDFVQKKSFNCLVVLIPSLNGKFTKKLWDFADETIKFGRPLYILTDELKYQRIFDVNDIQCMTEVEDIIAVKKSL